VSAAEGLAPAAIEIEVAPSAPSGSWSRAILRDPFGRMGALLLFALLVFAIATPLLAEPDATSIQATRKLLSPAAFASEPGAPTFGTDHLGRDLGVMAALGLRTSFVIGILAVLLSAAIGWVIGGVSGFVGGRLDDLGGRLMDLFGAFPGLLLIIALMAALGPSPKNMVIVLALASWESFGRVARAAALRLRGLPFIDAARVGGASSTRTLLTHGRLNTLPIMAALCVIQLPRLILGEATLSFLGFGLDASSHSLGSLIAAERDYLQVNTWSVTLPGLVLAVLCVGTALLGLGLRNVQGSFGRRVG
jgi:peptide/nickel transport system permease protein